MTTAIKAGLLEEFALGDAGKSGLTRRNAAV
jgi:hypothetical protein